MIILKRVEYIIKDEAALEGLLSHIEETIAKVAGISLQDILFPKKKKGFVLVLDCETEKIFHEWRKVCPPPPPGAMDRFEVLLTRDEYFVRQK